MYTNVVIESQHFSAPKSVGMEFLLRIFLQISSSFWKMELSSVSQNFVKLLSASLPTPSY